MAQWHRQQLISSSWYHRDGQLISSGWRYWTQWTIPFSCHSGCRNGASPVPIQEEGLETAALCTWWTPGRWTGPTIPEVQWSVAWDSQTFVVTHYYILYHIITFTIITNYYILYFYFASTLLLHIISFTLIMFHYKIIITYYCIIITSLLLYYYKLAMA